MIEKNINTTTHVRAVFKDSPGLVEEPTVFDNNIEEEDIRSRVVYRNTFLRDVLKKNTENYSKLCWRLKHNQTNDITKELISNCVDRQELQDKGIDYLEVNTALAMNVLVILDLVKLNIQLKLKVNMTTLDNTACYNDNDDYNEDSYISLYVDLL